MQVSDSAAAPTIGFSAPSSSGLTLIRRDNLTYLALNTVESPVLEQSRPAAGGQYVDVSLPMKKPVPDALIAER